MIQTQNSYSAPSLSGTQRQYHSTCLGPKGSATEEMTVPLKHYAKSSVSEDAGLPPLQKSSTMLTWKTKSLGVVKGLASIEHSSGGRSKELATKNCFAAG